MARGTDPESVVRLLRDKVRRRLDRADLLKVLAPSDDADDIASEILLAFRADRPQSR